MKKYILLISFLLIATQSCKDDKKTDAVEAKSQMETVMEIHDEVMPKMGKLTTLMGKLDAKMETDDAGDYSNAKVALQKSYDGMMDWMSVFMERFDMDEISNGKALTKEKQQWLDEEETKVKALRTQINTSIEEAEALLK